MARYFWVIALLLLSCSRGLAQSRQYVLKGPADSAQLLPSTPRQEFRLEFTLNYEKPGVVLDTVGINAAPVGSWAIRIGADERLNVQVYDPARQSSGRVANGWHILTSSGMLARDASYRVIVEFSGGVISLQISDAPAQTLTLATPLSGQAVWVGDFPGDDSWGARYNIHPAFTGTLAVHYAGPPTKPQPPTANAGAGVVDETGSMTAAEMNALNQSLQRLAQAHNIRLAIAILPDGEEAAAAERGKQLRDSLIARGVLGRTHSGLFLLAGNTYRYHYDGEMEKVLSWPTVRDCWQKVGANQPRAAQLSDFIKLLAATLGSGSTPVPPEVTLPVVTPPDNTAPPTTPVVNTNPMGAETVDAGARAIEAACRAGDLDKVSQLMTPVARASLLPALTARRDDLIRIANLLQTRKLVHMDGAYAEYEVSEKGRQFSLVLEKVAGAWRLASF